MAREAGRPLRTRPGAEERAASARPRGRAARAGARRSSPTISTRLHGEEDVHVHPGRDPRGAARRASASATAWVFLEDEKDGRLRLAAHRGLAARLPRASPATGLGECLCRQVFASGHGGAGAQHHRVPAHADDRRAGLRAAGRRHACVPLAFNGHEPGRAERGGPARASVFDAEELRFLETVGRQLCLAVEGARHLKAERLYNQEARALAALNKGIGESLDPEAVLEAVGRTALEVLRVDRVHILLGSDPRRLTVAHLAGLPHPELREGPGPRPHRAGREPPPPRARGAACASRPRTGRRTSASTRSSRGAGRAPPALILPLVARKATLGLLVLTSASPHRWTEDQVDVAEALASQASVALENARLYEKARRAYRELNEAQARIIQSEKMAVVGTFASGPRPRGAQPAQLDRPAALDPRAARGAAARRAWPARSRSWSASSARR